MPQPALRRECSSEIKDHFLYTAEGEKIVGYFNAPQGIKSVVKGAVCATRALIVLQGILKTCRELCCHMPNTPLPTHGEYMETEGCTTVPLLSS
jgi:hypothetical protein